MAILRGKKVLLRPCRQGDLTGIQAWLNDGETTRYLSSYFDLPHTAKSATSFLEENMTVKQDCIRFVVADLVTEEYWGQVSLEHIDRRNGCAELSIVIAQAEQRGKGIGREAIALMLRYAFETQGLRRVELSVFADNSRARLCYLKSGFVEEGVARQKVWKDGKYRDVVAMAILREEYEQHQEAKA